MTYKLFMCCLNVTESTAYVFINLIDVVFTIFDLATSKITRDEGKFGIIPIIWIVCAITAFVIYLAKK